METVRNLGQVAIQQDIPVGSRTETGSGENVREKRAFRWKNRDFQPHSLEEISLFAFVVGACFAAMPDTRGRLGNLIEARQKKSGDLCWYQRTSSLAARGVRPGTMEC